MVDCKVKPPAMVGQVRITFVPERSIVSWGNGKERLNTRPESWRQTALAVEAEAIEQLSIYQKSRLCQIAAANKNCRFIFSDC